MYIKPSPKFPGYSCCACLTSHGRMERGVGLGRTQPTGGRPPGCEGRIWFGQLGEKRWKILLKGDNTRTYREIIEHKMTMGQRELGLTSSDSLCTGGGRNTCIAWITFLPESDSKNSLNFSWKPINQSAETDSSQPICVLIIAFWKHKDCIHYSDFDGRY